MHICVLRAFKQPNFSYNDLFPVLSTAPPLLFPESHLLSVYALTLSFLGLSLASPLWVPLSVPISRECTFYLSAWNNHKWTYIKLLSSTTLSLEFLPLGCFLSPPPPHALPKSIWISQWASVHLKQFPSLFLTGHEIMPPSSATVLVLSFIIIFKYILRCIVPSEPESTGWWSQDPIALFVHNGPLSFQKDFEAVHQIYVRGHKD